MDVLESWAMKAARDIISGIPPYSKTLAEEEHRMASIIASYAAPLVAQRAEQHELLRDIVDDLEARWDMNAPFTNPGIKSVVKRAKSIIAVVKGGG